MAPWLGGFEAFISTFSKKFFALLYYMLTETQDLKIAIIGGGWYGCHLGLLLRERGLNVEILERNTRLFQESSSKNQCRLHLGLHYARSWATRRECLFGYTKLLELYPETVQIVKENLYVVAKHSLLDFETISDIFTSSNVPFEVVESASVAIGNAQAIFRCNEMSFDHAKAEILFWKRLGATVKTGVAVEQVIQGESDVLLKTTEGDKTYHKVIDCTYNALGLAQEFVQCFYQPCISLLYAYKGDSSGHPSITVIDGDFASLYQYHGDVPNLFTLTSVKHTPLGNYLDYKTCEIRMKTISASEIIEKRSLFEQEILPFVPKFKDNFGNIFSFSISRLFYIRQN